MANTLNRRKVGATRWVTFYEAGAVVYDRIHGWWDAFPLTHPDHPRRHDEEESLVVRLRRSYQHEGH